MKACPRPLSFHDIIVAIRSDQSPYGIVLDHTREKKPVPDHPSRGRRCHLQFLEERSELESRENRSLEDLSGQIVPLSITHDGEYATAVALHPEQSPLEELSDASTRIKLAAAPLYST